ncbi:MAG: DUF1735 domain-containing protein [Prolixibacteraceae bacterium]
MRNLINLKYTALWFAMIGGLLIQSCNDDEQFDVTGSRENKVYLNIQSWGPVDAPKNSVVFNVTNTPVGSIIANADKIETKFAVQCTHAAASDIVVRFEIDNSLIADGYSALPNGVTVTMDKSELVIPKGSTVSADSITVSVGNDNLGLLTTGQYMAPVKIVSLTNAQLSDNLTAAFLLVRTSYTNCIDQATSVPGTAAGRTGWKATVNGTDQGNRLFDNNRSTYFYGNNFTLEVDLGTVYENITGLALGYYSRSYSMRSATVYTSVTGTDNYEFQGSPAFPSATPQYVRFYNPVRARYVKIVVLSGYSASGVAMSEFSAYQQ